MKRWDMRQMLNIGSTLFAKIHQRKHHAHHNHEVHFMARKIEHWLPQGIQSMLDGSYTPRCLKRYYFADETVDQLHGSDRIFQHLLLKQLKGFHFLGIHYPPTRMEDNNHRTHVNDDSVTELSAVYYLTEWGGG